MIKFWVTNARPTSLPQSILPSVVAVCLAISAADFSWGLAILAVLGVALGHLGLNLFDDYFDYKKKNSTYRDELVHEGFRVRIGKCPYLTSGQATLRHLLVACLVFCGVAVILGAIIWWFRGRFVVYVAALAAVLGIFYSGPPLRLSYHGFGELLIGLIFGPLNMIGTYYAACGQVDSTILLISVPVGLLVMNIVYVHSILDFIPDKKIGKRTLAVLLNNTTAMLVVLFLVIFVPFGIIAWGIFTGGLPVWVAGVFLTFPLAISLFYLMLECVKHPDRQFAPKFWMGPMAHWERMQQAGIDWFMIRWFSARNLLSFFCLIIVILSVYKLFV
ncbi:MAG: prenyltransferase [Candidatus Symbiothrix sp.]|nr:prenyltransferase [Candidatus Symbiothrix sp.]